MNRSITATPKFNRWVPVAASIAIQLCMGTAYIWSVFQSYLIISQTPDALFNWPASYGTLAYSLLLAVDGREHHWGNCRKGRYQVGYRSRVAWVGILYGQIRFQATPWLLWLHSRRPAWECLPTDRLLPEMVPDKEDDRHHRFSPRICDSFTPVAEALIASYGVLNRFP